MIDEQIEEKRERGIELEFHQDVKVITFFVALFRFEWLLSFKVVDLLLILGLLPWDSASAIHLKSMGFFDERGEFLTCWSTSGYYWTWYSLVRSCSSQEIPVWMRPFVYKAWSRAFHSSMITLSFKTCDAGFDDLCRWSDSQCDFTDLEEAALPLEEYASLRDFFVRSLKQGCRPIDPDPRCLVTGNKNVVTFFYADFLF